MKINKILIKRARYIIINIVFAISIYYGFFENIEGALNVALFMAWGMGILGTIILLGFWSDYNRTAKILYTDGYTPSAPFWFDCLFDLCVLVVFVYFGYIWLSIFYTLGIVAGGVVRDSQKDLTLQSLMRK